MARITTNRVHNSGERCLAGTHYSLSQDFSTPAEWVVAHMMTGVRHVEGADYETAYRAFCRLEELPTDVCSECGEEREVGALCMDCYVSAMFRQAAV